MDATRDKWAQKAEKQKMKSLPFVVACRDEGAALEGQGQGQGNQNGTQTQSGAGMGEGKGWVVVGITGGMEDGDVRKKYVVQVRKSRPQSPTRSEGWVCDDHQALSKRGQCSWTAFDSFWV